MNSVENKCVSEETLVSLLCMKCWRKRQSDNASREAPSLRCVCGGFAVGLVKRISSTQQLSEVTMPKVDCCGRELSQCDCGNRSRSRERREREGLNTDKEPVKDLTDLLHRLDCRAEKRELQTKDEMTKLIENNDEKWKTRITEDREEILRIQDEKTDMKITQSESKQNAELEKLRKEIVDVKKESINLKASGDSTTLLFGGLQDMTFEAAEKWVKDQIKDRTLEEPSLVYHKADDFNGIIFAEFSTEKMAEHIAR